MKITKRVPAYIFAAIFFLAGTARAQIVYSASNNGNNTYVIDTRGLGPFIARLAVIPAASGVTTCTVQIDGSSDSVTFGSADILASQSCTTRGAFLSALAGASWIRLNISQTGTGNVQFNLNVDRGATVPGTTDVSGRTVNALPATGSDGQVNIGAFPITPLGNAPFWLTGSYIFNGTTWDRARSGVSIGSFLTHTALQQGPTILNAAPTASTANAAATVTLTGAAGTRVCVRSIAVKATGAAATFTLTVSDGATTVLDLGTQSATLNGAALLFSGQPLLCGSTGNNVTVNIGAGGASAITTTSVIADRQ